MLVGALALGVILASDVFHSGANVETLLFGSLLADRHARPRARRRSPARSALVGEPSSLGRALARDRLRRARARARSGSARGCPTRLLLVLIALAVVVGAVGDRRAARDRAVRRPGRDRAAVDAAAARLAARDRSRSPPSRGSPASGSRCETNAPPGATIAVLARRRVRARRRRRAGVSRRAGAAATAAGAAAAAGRARWSRAAAARRRLRAIAARRRRDDHPDRRLGPRGRRRRRRRAPDPAAEHRPARLRAAAERRRGGRPGASVVFENGDNLDALDGQGRRRRRAATRRSSTSAAACPSTLPGETSGPGGLPRTTRTGGTTRATPRPRSSGSATRSCGPTPARKRDLRRERARPTWRSCSALDRGIAACIAQVPPAERKLVTDHDAFDYFASRYGIEVDRRRDPVADDAGAAVGGRDREADRADQARARARRSSPRARSTRSWRKAIAARDGRDAPTYTLYGDTLGPRGSTGATYLTMEAANADAMVARLHRRRKQLHDRGHRVSAARPRCVEVDGLAAGYGGPPVLEGVAFELERRPSGSACSARTAAASRRCSGCCSASSQPIARARSTPRGRCGVRPADRALAARLPGERARRRADGHALPRALVAAARPAPSARARSRRSTRVGLRRPRRRARSASSRAASASACSSRARSCRTRRCCCSTSRSPASTSRARSCSSS